MGYRIHLNFCKKKDWEDYLTKSREIDSLYSLPIDNVERIEICSDIPLSSFDCMYLVNDEYQPYQLDKKDLKYILDFYIDRQLEIKEDLENVYKKVFEGYNKVEGFKNVESEIFLLLNKVSNDIINKEFYWSDLKEREYVKDTDTYSFQYFYLVKLYESFIDETDTIILTHG